MDGWVALSECMIHGWVDCRPSGKLDGRICLNSGKKQNDGCIVKGVFMSGERQIRRMLVHVCVSFAPPRIRTT